MTLDVQIVFPWKAGLWEQRLASTSEFFIQILKRHPYKNRFGFAFAMQS